MNGAEQNDKKEVKPIQKAVALSYKDGDTAPFVVAKGMGIVAGNILKKADEHKVKTYKDKELVDELTKIELGLNIPSELYQAVASVLLFISDLEKGRNASIKRIK